MTERRAHPQSSCLLLRGQLCRVVFLVRVLLAVRAGGASQPPRESGQGGRADVGNEMTIFPY